MHYHFVCVCVCGVVISRFEAKLNRMVLIAFAVNLVVCVTLAMSSSLRAQPWSTAYDLNNQSATGGKHVHVHQRHVHANIVLHVVCVCVCVCMCVCVCV